MIEAAVWLGVVGLCDLLRAARDVTTSSRRLLIVGIGGALLLFAGVALDPSPARLVALLAGWLGCFLLWLLGSAAALSGGGVAPRAVAFVGLGAGVAFGLLGDGLVADEVSRRLPGVLGDYATEQVVLLLGVALAQLATANVAVRLVLDAVGVPASTNEKQLKGGRMLGPMERLFVVGLGMAGQLTAASVVVAAKGLLRFPELQRGSRSGPSDITEYFLIGSFASWLVALGGIGLLALGWS